MAAWELIHLWNYAERKIALNVCEIKHGVPFVGVARFGFYDAPTPKDLAGILNANALYSIATGVFRVCGGVFLIFHVGNADLEVLLPLGTSLCSLVLSLSNVLLDFSGTLAEIEAEERFAEEIRTRNASKRTTDIKKFEDQLERETRRIESKYQGRTDVQAGIDKENELSSALSVYSHSVKGVEDKARDILTIEIKAYRSRLEQFKHVMKDLPRPSAQRRPSAYEDCQRHIIPYQEQKDSIRADIQGRVRALDSALPADEFEQALEAIHAEADTKLKILYGQIDKVKLNVLMGSPAAGGEAATGP
jgi:hypothetical protein